MLDTPAGGQINYLDAIELASHLKVTKRWIQEWTRRGVIPAIKVGRKYFYTLDDVDAALRAHEAAA